ncbi:endonuclease III domain-containing protein [Flexistipes sp.]|uniref:endonuclease III domain-containing protein n=1 Tax=Flexistipes sp. TaxID=3088135 RepID=UPI002E1F00CC|nr:endonuclease III [Flexistipes sp.]
MKTTKIHEFYSLLEDYYFSQKPPSVTQISDRCKRDPFRVLISTIISLRTKDSVTLKASESLFELSSEPEKMMNLAEEEIINAIYPAGFYRRKAVTIKAVCKDIVERFDGKVPADLDELLSLKGVGRKTANLVLVEGFGMDAVCVDTHVHRICNRAGFVKTKTPDETEMRLREILPVKYWKKWNEMLVSYGQNVCKPRGPLCSSCKLFHLCDKVGVKIKGDSHETPDR